MLRSAAALCAQLGLQITLAPRSQPTTILLYVLLLQAQNKELLDRSASLLERQAALEAAAESLKLENCTLIQQVCVKQCVCMCCARLGGGMMIIAVCACGLMQSALTCVTSCAATLLSLPPHPLPCARSLTV